ncbi:response regulator [Chitinophaga pendula]|uniref:response regulator transcription factor n=1 Tax=Chitinophaga TaxID=79328 RepID=UPI000BAEE546|nr:MULTISPECIES: response regulator [Chitinophaga]ASZ12115.1 hypothetical protein CK934_14680 [Chitinophaga sp. MD30]UCJ04847.1 response regulator [Chitinophaga pendula]
MKSIVLVEDDESIRDIYLLSFKAGTYDIMAFENGNVIMNSEIEVPDLFILDKQIAGTDGLELCRFIKKSERYKGVPVIMSSANPDIEILAKNAGADGVLTKPFSLKELRETISDFLKQC